MPQQNEHSFNPHSDIFRENFADQKTQLIWEWVSADLETPVSAYLKLCGYTAYSFLLESVEGGATLGRYSVIGTNPDFLWKCSQGGKVETKTAQGDVWTRQDICAKTSLKENITVSSIDIVPEGLPPMCGLGLFGYIGYDMIRLVEDIPDNNPDDLQVPDSVLSRPSILAIFDNVKNMICVATPVYAHAGNSDLPVDMVYSEARTRVKNALKSINAPLDRTLLDHKTKLQNGQEITSNTPKEDYKAAVEKAVEYIHAGEIFQVVPSQRFSIDFDLPSFELYRSLRSVNPSPFLFHLSFEGFSLVGSSPEILVRVRDDMVTIRPIAGTRKRGKNAIEDKALAEDLLSDTKECSEHLMLLDLGRNDVGRVAEIGSVNVTDQFQIELYSHVMHIVSNVEGKLRQELDIVDALFAGFPAGTVSGAPKIRAMEIIDELEISRRGTYAGGVGYFSQNAMDSCIALRTALVKDHKIYVQAGGGVVADSDAELEYQECCNKAKAVFHAAELVIQKCRTRPQ
ncbi:MAG: anthranilate synthase component I [Zetaproteobacteria bacterium]|nr:MAG: anthranilate synthase component I [Zetaproteobacteria bacterium]